MRFDKFTTKFQQALADAQSIAVGNDQQLSAATSSSPARCSCSRWPTTRARPAAC
jgi:hypothetical protein